MDQERILSKFDELEDYLEELEEIIPKDYEEYASSIEKKRACERLLQISIESVIDICNILASEMRIGLPMSEDDLFEKLKKKKIINGELSKILTKMKGCRNILVHKYGVVKDEEIFEILTENLEDFEKFKEEIIRFLKKQK